MDIYARLGRQSLARELTDGEMRLARALEAAFKAGETDFGQLAARLNEEEIPLPSGAGDAWSPAVLERELACVNGELDAAYAAGGGVRI